jgi:hypothetical protein
MRRLRTLAAAGALLAAGAAGAEDLRPALEATVRFAALDGRALAEVLPEAPFRITVTLDNRLGGALPPGLALAGWLRRVVPGDLSCGEAARAFLATGRLPTDAVPLNGPVLAVAAVGGGLTVADPDLDLASANLIGATTFPEAPAALLVDPGLRRFVAVLSEAGRVVAVEPFGAALHVIAEGLDHPTEAFAASDGAVWVLEGTGARRLLRVPQDGSPEELGTGVQGLAGAADLVVTWSAEEVRLREAETGATRIVQAAPDVRAAVPVGAVAGVAALAWIGTDGTLSLAWADAPDSPLHLALPEPARRLEASPDGRWIVAYDPDGGPAWLVDLARSRVHQSIAAEVPIAEAVFAGRSLFLLLADQSAVGVVDLAAAGANATAQVRRIALAPAATAPRTEHPGRRFLVPLGSGAGVLALHADSATAFLVEEAGMLGDAPPMTAVRLRGGVPLAAAALDRSFRQTAPGEFETVALLPGAGAWELVTTTGLGGAAQCAALPGTVVGPAPETPGTISALTEGNAVRLEFRDAEGSPAAGQEVKLLLTALSAPWRADLSLVTDAAGRSAPIILPDLRPLAVTAEAAQGRLFRPLFLE